MAYEKGINVNVLAESGQTDEETIEMYEGKVPGISIALKGDEKLNELLFDYTHQRNLLAIKERYIDEGYNEEDAIKLSEEQSAVLRENALKNYEALKKQRAAR